MIPPIRKILYALDFSEHSSDVLAYAVDMAKRHGATLVVLHSVERGHTVSYAGAQVEAMMRQVRKQEQVESREEVEKRVGDFCRAAMTSIDPSCVELVTKILVPVGDTIEEIVKAVEEEGCDAVVVGIKKEGFLTGVFFESVACAVLHRLQKPVFVIPMLF